MTTRPDQKSVSCAPEKFFINDRLKAAIRLPDSIMVVRQILALYVRVRILIGQPNRIEKKIFFQSGFFFPQTLSVILLTHKHHSF